MKRFAMLALAALLGPTAQAAHWVEISSTPDGSVRQYLDLDSMERNLGLVELDRMFNYQPPRGREADGKPYASEVVHTEFDCPSHATRQVSMARHAEAMGKGDLVQQNSEPSLWDIDNFDEFTQPVWKIACRDFQR